MPREILDTVPELAALWKETAGREIGAVMDKAKEMLLSAGVPENLVSVQIADGSRNPANDIIAAAKAGGCGTIVVGRKGSAGKSDFTLGDVARKIIGEAADCAVWVVA